MRKLIKLALSLALLATSVTLSAKEDGVDFNSNWRFYKGQVAGGEATSLDDDGWRELTLPHDWAVEGPFDKEYSARAGGLPFHGEGWYRKTFTASSDWAGKLVRVAFDGAMSEATVWINGQQIYEHPYGYTGFEVDMTPYLNIGGENTLAVRLTPRDMSSRWYPGAGLYRNVWLRVDEPVHVAQWGVFVTTPSVSEKSARIQIEASVENNSKEAGEFTLEHRILDSEGTEVGKVSSKLSIEAGASKNSVVYTNMSNPKLWGVYNPNLYTVETKVLAGDKVMDLYNTKFGVRKIEFNRDGFFLNGEKVMFEGVCLHHDNGPLGSIFNRRAEERKLQIMIDMGVNAIRTSHNPPTPEFLDLCDEMGLLVIDELFDEWRIGKVENAYSNYFDEWHERDLTGFMKRDRNHPSVIMWSLGNEILEQLDNVKDHGFVVAKELNDMAHAIDPTRPTTLGFNYHPQPFTNNLAQQTDIVGANYNSAVYGKMVEAYPDMLYYGSETSSCTSSRGVYHLPIEKYDKHESLQVTSYDIIGPPWATPPDVQFHMLKENPRFMGEFIWTGFDYLGEPTPYGGRDNATNGKWDADWPSHSSYFGAVDLCGLPKDRFYLYQSQWTDEPMVHMLPHWNWEKGMDVPVYVYTNCDEAELFLNGKSLGKKIKGVDKTTIPVKFNNYPHTTFDSEYRLSWDVPFEAGTIEVKAYKDGKLAAEKKITTAKKAYRVVMEADREVIAADGKDLCYVTVKVVDKNGNLCPNADNLINYKVSGAGHFRAAASGNSASLESFQAPHHRVFSGMGIMIVESDALKSGKISITASSKGLKSQTIDITSK